MPETASKLVIRQAQGLENVSKVKFTSKIDTGYVPTLANEIASDCSLPV